MRNIYIPADINQRIENAVSFFWQTRRGSTSGQTSSGSGNLDNRNAVIGGKQLDGFFASHQNDFKRESN